MSRIVRLLRSVNAGDCPPHRPGILCELLEEDASRARLRRISKSECEPGECCRTRCDRYLHMSRSDYEAVDAVTALGALA